MTIVPLIHPYNGYTHVRFTTIELSFAPSVAHFKMGQFAGSPPAMPFSAAELPSNWSERDESNTANLPYGITSLMDILVAIDATLQENA